jgi:putative salt-induced outer membrane protein YdiY
MVSRDGFLVSLLLVAIFHCNTMHGADLPPQPDHPPSVAADATADTNAPIVTTNQVITTTNIQSQSPEMPAFTEEDFRTSWQIPPPDDDTYDWVQLKSGEWLKGEIKSMQADTLSFDSDEMDLQEFKWKDVHKLISPHMNTIMIDDGQRRERALGSLWITRDKVIVDGEDTISYPRKDLFGIVPGVPKEVNYWGGKISLGLTLRSGNTDQVEYNARISLARRTPATRLTLDYLGNFSETDGVEIANNHRGTANFDVFLSRKLFLRVPFAEYYRDPFQNIAGRLTTGIGIGYDIYNRFNSPVVEWNVTLGPAYQYTWYQSVEPGEASQEGGAAVVVGTRFNWDITKRIEFTTDIRGQVSTSEANSSTLHTELIWELELTKRLDLDISFIWDYQADPRADSTGAVPLNSDFRMVLSLGLDF